MMKARANVVAALSVQVLLCSRSLAGAPSFQGLGHLPGDPLYTYARGVSADGSVVVGDCWFSRDTTSQAFLWKEGVMTSLGDLPGGFLDSAAYGVSEDGTVVVGYGQSAAGAEALVWENGVMSGLGSLPGGSWSIAANVSADGAVVVGWGNGEEGFRWENGLMSPLGYLPGGPSDSRAYGVSADGVVVVGWSSSGEGDQGFRWEAGVMTALGQLPGAGAPSSGAAAVSADGSVVVGASRSQDSGPLWEAFRWESGVMTGLGAFPSEYHFFSYATDVSADGSVVVGTSLTGTAPYTSYRAFVWTEATGMLKLSDVLTALGVNLTGWGLHEATGISDDGLTIVGFGGSTEGNEGWIATLPVDWIDRVSYELTVSIAKSDWAGWGTVDIEPNLAVYAVGRIVTLTAQPNEGNVFKTWRIYDPNHPGDANYTVTDANNPLTLVMMGDRDVVAVFKCGSGIAPLLPMLLAMLGLLVLMKWKR